MYFKVNKNRQLTGTTLFRKLSPNILYSNTKLENVREKRMTLGGGDCTWRAEVTRGADARTYCMCVTEQWKASREKYC